MDRPSSYSGCTRDRVKCDSVGLTVEGAFRLTYQIREAEAKREEAKASRKRYLEALLEAEERLKSVERLESLLKNRRSELVRRGLESLEVEPDNPSEPAIVLT